MENNRQVLLSTEEVKAVRRLYVIRRTMSGLEKSKKALRSGLLELMAEFGADTAVFPDGSTAFVLKPRTNRRVDIDRMLKEHPEMARYVTESETTVLTLV